MKHALTLPAAISIAVLVTLSACTAKPEIPEQLPFATAGASLTVTQVGTNCSANGVYSADVAWQVADTLALKIEIQVGREGKVFARSNERIGSEATGEWVSPGSLFLLLDRDSKQLLAATPAGAGNCNGSAPAP
ncbi:MAG: hypothetical protein M3374_01345 [Pseudomonadota bacterium]|nr:hypothetical protein [Pseudomonadota bacterium]